MLWIRIRMDPEILPGSGTRKIQSWIRIRNKSFRIHNTAGNSIPRSLPKCTPHNQVPVIHLPVYYNTGNSFPCSHPKCTPLNLVTHLDYNTGNSIPRSLPKCTPHNPVTHLDYNTGNSFPGVILNVLPSIWYPI